MAATLSGNFVVTSPNQVVIWEIPKGAIYLRSDCRYGPHDPTLLPQPYISEYTYLGAIPSKPMDENDSLLIMWWNPTPGDFLSSSGGVIDGIGWLRRVRQDILLDMILLLLERDMLNISSRIG